MVTLGGRTESIVRLYGHRHGNLMMILLALLMVGRRLFNLLYALNIEVMHVVLIFFEDQGTHLIG